MPRVDHDSNDTRLAEHIARDGYVIVSGAISGETIAALRESLQVLLQSEQRAGESTIHETLQRLSREQDQCLYELYKVSTRLSAMNALREECLGWVRRICGTHAPLVDLDSHLIFGVPNDTRLIWDWHQESTYDVVDRPVCLNFCVPVLAPATRQNGTMSVLRGSHKLGQLEFESHQPLANGATSKVPKDIAKIVENHEEVFFLADPGAAIIFDRNLVHRSNRNTSTETRVTAVARFSEIDAIPSGWKE